MCSISTFFSQKYDTESHIYKENKRERGVFMNRKREAYDRLAVGDRIRKKRIQLGFSQDEVAERIDRAPKYCSDIERGTCGMSTETMLAISECLDMSLDYMMFGEQTDEEARRQENDELAVIHILSGCSKQQRDYAIRLLKLYIASMQISQNPL